MLPHSLVIISVPSGRLRILALSNRMDAAFCHISDPKA
jgi:hypothetical protein